MTAAVFAIESDWITVAIGVAVAVFSLLAWFMKSIVGQAESRLEASIGKLAQQIIDLADRVGRLERQVDETIIPKQERIARKLDTEDDE